MTPKQRQQIRDLIAAGENATQDKVLGFSYDVDGSLKTVTEKGAFCARNDVGFFIEAANAREAIEAMEKENEKLRDLAYHKAGVSYRGMFTGLLDVMDENERLREAATKVVGYYNFGGIKGNPESLAALGNLALALTNETKESGDVI